MTTPEENKALARRFMEEVLNKKDLDVAEELIADEFIDHNPAPGFPNDKKGALEWFRMMFEAFPDMRVEVHDIIAEGDRVAIHGTGSGTHKGEFMGVPATGKRVTMESIDILRNDDRGRALEHWGVIDSVAMMMQLGVIPPPGS